MILNTFISGASYQQLEYIESTGTQYIDSLYVPNGNTSFEIDFQLTATNQSPFIFGARTSSTSRAFVLSVGIIGTAYFFGQQYGSLGYKPSSGGTTNINTNRHTWKLDENKGVYYDDTLLGSYTSQEFTCPNNALIFSAYNGGSIGTKAKMRLYSLKVYENGLLVRNFVPTKYDGNVGLYDKVEGKFYYNSGTGEFIAGPIL